MLTTKAQKAHKGSELLNSLFAFRAFVVKFMACVSAFLMLDNKSRYWGIRSRSTLVFLGVFLFFLFVSPVQAQTAGPSSSANGSKLPFTEPVSHSVVVMDAATGTVIYYKNPDDEIPPASLTKLMTMHLAFREIEAGRASLDEIISPPRESWAVNQPPLSSVMGLANGQQLSLRDLLLGMAIFSGNDAATAVALRFAPSVDAFVGMMNREAASLGLSKTHFVDASGYSEKNMTTAREFAEFCRIYLEDHPESIRDYHSVMTFAYPKAENVAERYRGNPGTRLHQNHNTLLRKVDGVDGLKTGFIFESGYNIALTAQRNGTRFIVEILGAPSEWGGDRIRDDDGKKLLEWAFSNYKTIRPDPPALEPVRIWKGKKNYVNIAWDDSLEFTAASERGENLSCKVTLNDPLIAPLPAGSQAGKLVISDSQGELRNIPLVTVDDVDRGGFFKRLFDSIRLFFRRFA